MIRYFYWLYFQYDQGDDCTSSFDIGYFTTPAKAREQIEIYKDQPGFRDYGVSNFHIEKIGVKFSHPVNKEEVEIYVLDCEEQIDDDIDLITGFGAFATYEEAYEEQEKQKKKKAYRSAEFYINKWRPNVDLTWREGFTKYDE